MLPDEIEAIGAELPLMHWRRNGPPEAARCFTGYGDKWLVQLVINDTQRMALASNDSTVVRLTEELAHEAEKAALAYVDKWSNTTFMDRWSSAFPGGIP